MNKRSVHDALSDLAVVVPGAIGLFVVARTLAAYIPRDRMASMVVGAMAVVLVLGLIELLVRNRRAARLEHEVGELPAQASEETVASASPLLGSILRARLEQAPSPGLGESMAPFLTGLLVMLGLLGTLLGLFETVHGASHALTASADLSALRASLSTPISGLTRSFGCSAAGISASAMLGLAVALVRRREARTMRGVHAYATGPLRALAPIRAQTRAIEALAGQGLALPDAAQALERVGKELASLSSRLVSVQDAGVEAQKQAFQQLVAELRAELSAVAREVGTNLSTSAAPLLEQMGARLLASTEQQATSLTRVSSELSAQLEKEARSRTEQAGALLKRLAESAQRADQQRAEDAEARRREAEEHAARLASAAERAERQRDDEARARRNEAEAHVARLGEAARALERQLEQDLAIRREAASAELERLGELARGFERELSSSAKARRDESLALIAELARRFEELERERVEARRAELESLSELALRAARDAEAREASHAARFGELVGRAEASAARLGDQEAERLARLDGLTTRVGGDLTRIREAFEQRLANERDEGRAQEERVQTALLALTENARAFAQIVLGQRDAIEQLVGGLPPLFSEVAAATQRGSEAALAKLIESSEQRLDRIVSTLEQEQAGRAESAREHERATAATLERLRESASLLDRNIEQQQSVLEGLSQRVGGLLEQLIAAARQSAESTLARLADSAEEQAMRWAKLEGELAEGRLEHARGLEEQLASHAHGLEAKLAQSAAVVHEAASLWKASSAEMQAIVEAFAQSVERQREASDAWLESLGDIEASVERSGRHAAADALADQLASTQEVFARQLQFQRELFEQLRNLRSVSRGGSIEQDLGGSDVSV